MAHNTNLELLTLYNVQSFPNVQTRGKGVDQLTWSPQNPAQLGVVTSIDYRRGYVLIEYPKTDRHPAKLVAIPLASVSLQFTQTADEWRRDYDAQLPAAPATGGAPNNKR